MKSLREALGTWSPVGGGDDPLAAVRAAWSEVVGADVAANAQPLKIERGALIVMARSGAWSQQLTFLGERIVRDLRAKLSAPQFETLRFRVGRLPMAAGAVRARPRTAAAGRATPQRAASTDAAEAIARFRDDVRAYWRAKEDAGWKSCDRCGALIAPRSGSLCGLCAGAHADERAGMTARLLYETPWLGYDGISKIVEGLTREEYDRIRRRLLARWWDVLRRAVRDGKLSSDGRERLVASSYVLLKSGIDPERIAAATVRNLLGDDVHALIYGTER